MNRRSELGLGSRRSLGLAQPAAVPKPASHFSPTDPVLRANPFPEVTDPICRLPLPTLFYRLEAVHLGDLLRIWVRSGTRVVSLGFSRVVGSAPDTRKRGGALREQRPYLRPSRFQGVRPLIRKENSYRDFRRRLRVRLRYRTLPREEHSPMPGSGILTRFPFDRRQATCTNLF